MIDLLNDIYRAIDEDPKKAKRLLSDLIEKTKSAQQLRKLGDPYDTNNPHSPFYEPNV